MIVSAVLRALSIEISRSRFGGVRGWSRLLQTSGIFHDREARHISYHYDTVCHGQHRYYYLTNSFQFIRYELPANEQWLITLLTADNTNSTCLSQSVTTQKMSVTICEWVQISTLKLQHLLLVRVSQNSSLETWKTGKVHSKTHFLKVYVYLRHFLMIDCRNLHTNLSWTTSSHHTLQLPKQSFGAVRPEMTHIWVICASVSANTFDVIDLLKSFFQILINVLMHCFLFLL